MIKYDIVRGEGGTTPEGLHWSYVMYKTRPGAKVNPVMVVYEESANGEGRLADQLRRQIASFRRIGKITISPRAPAWKDQAEVDRKPKGLTSILAHDKKGALEIWYQVTTPEHRATIYIRQGATTHAD